MAIRRAINVNTRTLPLLEVPKLVLRPVGNVDLKTAERFCRVFRWTFGRIELWAAQDLLACWAQLRRRTGNRDLPRVYLHESVPRSDYFWGRCLASGEQLDFNGAIVEQLPARPLAGLIAHELAHGVQVARGEKLDEDAANAYCCAWRMPMRALAAYSLVHSL